ncbi:MAG: FAD-linked oxidase C-terminal domain-containing protein [Haloarculaceae archaeon]
MGVHDGSDDPALDGRARYDYAGGDVARPGMVADLRERVDGEVRFDEYTRQLYATDASAYEVTPVGVVFPTATEDVAATVRYCAEREVPVLPRGGGTSLAGQAVNEAVVLDFTRHMDDLLTVDPDGRRARAQPGVLLGDLNAELAHHDLKFAPDPAWGDKSALGGAIGNNSTGAHSLQYGKTDAYLESCEAVLADGTVTTFGEVTLAELRERADPEGDLEARIYAAVARVVDEDGDAVEAAFPDLKRNVSGYNLDRLVDEARGAVETGDGPRTDAGVGDGPRTDAGASATGDVDPDERTVNLARLLAGSEGTLAVVTAATVALEPVPETKALALLSYDDLVTAMEDVTPILEHDPAAVEVLDDVLLDLAEDTEEFGALVEALRPEGAGAILLVEFYADNDAQGKQRVADLLADRVGEVTTAGVPQEGAETLTDAPVRAFHGQEAHDDAERERFWKLRKSGLPILLGRTSDAKHVSFIEDTAVPPENLPEYVADFRDLLEEAGTFASFYAHAGPGCLHIRPLIDLKSVEGIEQLETIAEGATDLVVEYGGSVSGEHGDGRARTRWNRKLYGQDVWELFRAVKEAFDPDWLLNPGQVVGYAPDERRGTAPERARAVALTDDLRFDPDYEFDAGFEPALNWRSENGMQGMVELCHGCGGCRGPQETTGGVMCPTYRAADEESTATRGRANALRQAMSGDLPADPTDGEFVDEIMDLCVGCKGCAKDCPSEVDMAKLKAEVEHAHHREHGVGLRTRLFGNVERVSRLGSALAPVSNWLASAPGSDWLAEKVLGIARERDLPTFASESFAAWFEERGPAVPEGEARRKALLFPDTYGNYSTPEVLRASVRVLEAAGVHVRVPEDVTASGRAAHSQGLLERARERAHHNVDALAARLDGEWDLVTAEPSDAVLFQSDYLDLLSGADARTVAANAYGVCEYLDRFDLDDGVEWSAPDEHLTYHGHCHQKAHSKDHHAVGVLRRAGYRVDPLDSTCCGMAGSFGYEAEHYSMSRAVGDLLFDQVADSPGETVVAPGASCRTQLGDRPGHERPPHPVERLDDAL